MSQNVQRLFKTLAANAARFLKYVWSFWGIILWRVTMSLRRNKILKTKELVAIQTNAIRLC